MHANAQRDARPPRRSGRGGDGEIVEAGAGRMVKNHKYTAGRSLRKEIWLPASAPANGQAGGDVVVAVDPAVRRSAVRLLLCPLCLLLISGGACTQRLCTQKRSTHATRRSRPACSAMRTMSRHENVSERKRAFALLPLNLTRARAPQVDSLLHLHDRREWVAPRGANGNPAAGSAGPKRTRVEAPPATPTVISVPPGTVVRNKKGYVLAALVQPGDAVRVAAGGAGGRGVVAPAKRKAAPKASTKRERKLAVRRRVPSSRARAQCSRRSQVRGRGALRLAQPLYCRLHGELEPSLASQPKCM
jgi:GTP1/OBG